MITTENYCDSFERFHPKQVVCSVKAQLNKSWQSVTLGRFFILFSSGPIVKLMLNLI